MVDTPKYTGIATPGTIFVNYTVTQLRCTFTGKEPILRSKEKGPHCQKPSVEIKRQANRSTATDQDHLGRLGDKSPEGSRELSCGLTVQSSRRLQVLQHVCVQSPAPVVTAIVGMTALV